MKLILPLLAAIALSSCGSTDMAQRRPVPPKGSDISDKAWNDPSIGGRPGGLLSDMTQGR